MIRCLDSSIFVKCLTPEEGSPAARALCLDSLAPGVALVGPPFLPAEVGSVLRKKTRATQLSGDEATALWDLFLALPVSLVQGAELWRLAWVWAERARLPTLYDACYLAAAELGGEGAEREFWTADAVLVEHLAVAGRPPWVHLLDEWVGLPA